MIAPADEVYSGRNTLQRRRLISRKASVEAEACWSIRVGLHWMDARVGRLTVNVAWAGGRLRMDQACLTIIIQRSWMDREDRGAGHHLPHLYGRERRVQLPQNGDIVEYRLDHGID